MIVDRGKELQPFPVDSHPVLVDSPSVARILPEPALCLSSDGCFTIDYVEQHGLAAGSSEETAERMGLLDFQHLAA